MSCLFLVAVKENQLRLAGQALRCVFDFVNTALCIHFNLLLTPAYDARFPCAA